MAACSNTMQYDAKSQGKFKGIHEPKGRVKGFRVEIRPSGSSTKIWVGTFDSRDKAMRAYDAAVYLTGKEPLYFVYPEGYFPSRPLSPLKEDVQILAKKFADRTDELARIVASLSVGVSSKAGQAKNGGSERTSPKTTVVEKVVEKMNSPLLPVSDWSLPELDQFLQNAEYMEVPAQLDCTHLDFSSVQSDEVLEESKVDLEKKAYHRGIASTQNILKSLPDGPLPALSDFPAVDDESAYLNFDSPFKASSKRKRSLSQDLLQNFDPLSNFDESSALSEGLFADEDWYSCNNGSWV